MQKMSRDGVIEINAVTGGGQSISKREADFDIRGNKPERETLFQVGTRLDDKQNNKKTAQRHNEPLRETENPQRQIDYVRNNEIPSHQADTVKHETVAATEQKNTEPIQNSPDTPRHRTAAEPSVNPRDPPQKTDGTYKNKSELSVITSQHLEDNTVKPVHAVPSDKPNGTGKLKTRSNDTYQERQPTVIRHKSESGVSPLKHQSEKLTFSETKAENPTAPKQKGGKYKARKHSKYKQNQSSTIQHEPPKITQIGEIHQADTVNEVKQDFNSRSNTPERETLSQVGTRSDDKTSIRQNKNSAIHYEPPKITQIGEIHQADTVNEVKQDFNLHGDMPERDTLSQVGTRSDDKTGIRQNKQSFLQHEPQQNDSTLAHGKEKTQPADATVIQPDNKSKLKTQRETVLQQNQSEIKTDLQPLALETPKTDAVQTEGEQINGTADILRDIPQNRPAAPPNNQRNPIIRQKRKGKFKQNRDTVYQHNKPAVLQHEPQKSDTLLEHKSETAQTKSAETEQAADTPQTLSKEPQNPVKQPKPQSSEQDTPVDSEAENTEIEQPSAEDTPTGNKPVKDDNPDSSLKQDKPGKLKFTEDETAPDKPENLDKKPNRKLEKAGRQADKAGKKLEKAKNKLPAKRKLRSERVFDEQKGKAKRKLHFEKEVKSQGQHLKGALPLRPVKAGANTLMLKAHSKIYQVEHENVAVKAVHRAEMIGEAGVRSALRHHKTAPYRKVAKLEKQAAKKTIRLNYQKALADNPKLKSNMLSRMWQKRKIKKDYAKAARETKKAAKAAKKAGSVTSEAVKLLAGAVRRHPVATAVIILLSLLLFMLMSLIGLGGGIGSGGLNAIIASSYLAEDEDIDNAELAYTEWETDLRIQIENTVSDRPGYNEYRYNIGTIGHNPYELMAYLTAMYQNFAFDAISDDLRAVFDEQYVLTFTEAAEIRYADPTDANHDGDYEPYDWKILTVTLTARPFGDVVFSRMNADQIPHYGILTMSGGGREYAGSPFDINWLPYVTSGYGYRIHPITGVKDFHKGIDIALPAGTEIHSAQSGTVTFAEYSSGYGNVVVIENADGLVTKYAHCDTLLVSAGQPVNIGDVIATVGSTGDSTGAHLHYEILKDGIYLNPAYFAANTP